MKRNGDSADIVGLATDRARCGSMPLAADGIVVEVDAAKQVDALVYNAGRWVVRQVDQALVDALASEAGRRRLHVGV